MVIVMFPFCPCSLLQRISIYVHEKPMQTTVLLLLAHSMITHQQLTVSPEIQL